MESSPQINTRDPSDNQPNKDGHLSLKANHCQGDQIRQCDRRDHCGPSTAYRNCNSNNRSNDREKCDKCDPAKDIADL
jgi:hypothetical protein